MIKTGYIHNMQPKNNNLFAPNNIDFQSVWAAKEGMFLN